MLNSKLLKKSLWLLILTMMALLSGCSHVRTKDGPPNFYVDETKIPDATPKLEKLSRSGNMDHYSVFGRRYNVMRTSKNYEEVGIASWYGTKFHSRHTSNGERYNMLAMTAAHKTLPLPTYVQVTNLKNGKKVIVKINDRGPFESNRLIDLSYVAAKKLGMIGHGTTYVDVKSVDPRDMPDMTTMMAKAKKPEPTPTPVRYANSSSTTDSTSVKQYLHYAKTTHKKQLAKVKTISNKNLYLHVGAFQQKTPAENLKKRLASVQTAPVKINRSSKLFHVQVGPFKDVASANRASKLLKSIGVHNTLDKTQDL